MKGGALRLAEFIVALAAASPWAPLAACGLEGGLGNALSAAYPGSLEVAFAARDAIEGGLLELDPALDPILAHDRADERLRALAAEMTAPKSTAAVAVLLIESGPWTRLTPKVGVWTVTEHIDAPQANDFTLIASELAVRDLVGGRLSADESLSRGLVVVSGERRYREPLSTALRQAFPSTVSTTALR